MRVLSVNRSEVREVQFEDAVVQTGIFKTRMNGAASVGAEGIIGDQQADRGNHGGLDKALYVYSFDNYAYWEGGKRSDGCLDFGYFGENLTVSGFMDDAVCIGDVLRVGNVIAQVTQPRVPCFKLGLKTGDKHFPKEFMRSGRCGFYLRVLLSGVITEGDEIWIHRRDSGGLSIAEAMAAILPLPNQQDVIERALQIPALSKAWRDDLTKRLKA